MRKQDRQLKSMSHVKPLPKTETVEGTFLKANDGFHHRGVNNYEKEHQLRSYRSKND